jgi:PKD repeat protein
VAIIKQTPDEGNTSTTFSFDSSTSYSLTSRLKLYTREIFNSNGDKTDTIQGKSIKKQFIKPGNYMVKLTLEDELGQTNVDTREVYVESSTPVPQFSITPTNKRAQASEFHLDATASSDLDVTNQNDSLEYKREFSNPNASKIISTEENNKKIVVQFDEIGTHTITLTVTDMYGKSAVIEKQVNVTSVLRPELTISPNAITRGKNVTFSVKTNKPVINYQRNFGDGTTNSNQSNQMTHMYTKI